MKQRYSDKKNNSINMLRLKIQLYTIYAFFSCKMNRQSKSKLDIIDTEVEMKICLKV